MKRLVAGALALAMMTGAGGGRADAQQRADADERGPVAVHVRSHEPPAGYVPLPWEAPDLAFPTIRRDAIVAVREDTDQLTFLDGDELGTFRAAPEGGTPFFGSGQPIFGMAAPPLLPGGVLRLLGTGDTGDRFLRARPPVDPATVIPKLGETFDQRRESFAFIGGVPTIPADGTVGSIAFPLARTVVADRTPGCRDNAVGCEPLVAEQPQPPMITTLPPIAPGPEPTLPPTIPGAPATTVPPTTAPTRATSPTTLPPATTAPPTTAPPAGTTTTTTVPTTTTTTVVPTTTTSPPTTTTTPPALPPTTTTTTAPVFQPNPPPATAFVLSNQREAGDLCLSNATGGTHNPGCDRLFDFGAGASGFMKTGTPYRVNLTLWNIDAHSDRDATTLRTYSAKTCTSSPVAASHAHSLCKGIELIIQRYSDAARTVPSQCVYGGGTATTCEFDPSRTLDHYASTHSSMATGAEIGSGLRLDAKAYLRISVQIRDTGIGKENRYLKQQAAVSMTWQMQSG